MQELRSKLWKVEPYPKGMKAIPQPIAGTAFFPGGTGIWKEVSVRESLAFRGPNLRIRQNSNTFACQIRSLAFRFDIEPALD
jgi:hypothetical protein